MSDKHKAAKKAAKQADAARKAEQKAEKKHRKAARRARAEVSALLDRYALACDGTALDTVAPALFVSDCTVDLPGSRSAGLAELSAAHRATTGAFTRTQHAIVNLVVDSAGTDEAVFQANTLIARVPHGGAEALLSGGRISGAAVRTAVGWRLIRVVWTTVWESVSD